MNGSAQNKIDEVLNSLTLLPSLNDLYTQAMTVELAAVQQNVTNAINALPVGGLIDPILGENYISTVYIPVNTAQNLQAKLV